jgi:tRNA threonylcarbamoyladenosine biosynthesis protein TsaB
VREARDDPPGGARPRHATKLLALIAELLDEGSSSWAQVDRIAVGVGPGTFTGLRIGIATATALGRAREIPLVGVSTLESLALGGVAEPRAGDAPAAILAVIDARRGEAFVAAWRAAGGGLGDRLLAPAAVPGAELEATATDLGPGVMAVGEGAVIFRAALENSGVLVPDDSSELHRVTATNHCRLAGRLPAGSPDEIRPEYLRLADAEIARRAADDSS